MATELAAAYVQIIPSARGIQSSIASELSGPVGKAGTDAGDGFMGTLGGSLKAGLVGVGIAAAAVFAKGFADALGQDKALDQIAASLGLDPSTQAEVGSLAGKLYADAYGDSFAEVASAVAGVREQLGVVDGSELEDVTKNALDFATAMGQDVTTSIEAARTLIDNGLVKDGAEAFDLLTRGFQEIPTAVRDELLQATSEYSTFFSDLGISGEEAFGLIVDAAESGGNYGVDKVGDALKELTIRATDMSTASVDAYETAGLSAEDMAGRFLAGGDTARGALGDLVTALQGIDDPVARANAAIGLFGTPLEDLSVTEIPEFLDGLAEMGGGLGDVGGAADEMGDTLNDNAATKIESFKRTALQGLTNFIGDEVLPALEDLSGWVSETAGPALSDFGDFLATDVIPTLAEFYAGVAEDITPALQDLWTTVQEDLLPALEDLWAVYKQDILPVQREVYDFLAGFLIPIVGYLLEAIANLVSQGIIEWNKLKTNVSSFVETAQGVYDKVTGIWDALVGFIGGLPGRISGVAAGMWNGLSSGFTGVVNSIISAWNSIDFAIHLSIPNWVPGLGGKSWNVNDIVPDLPLFSSGYAPSSKGRRIGGVPIAHTGGNITGTGEGLIRALSGERVLSVDQNREFDRLVNMAESMERTETSSPLVGGDFIVQGDPGEDPMERGRRELERIRLLAAAS